jgi:four helix bundle protein
MSNAATNTNLIAHTKALEAAGTAIRLVMRVPAPLKSIADQVIRSASSVPANIAEGHGRFGRDRSNHWRIAYASAKEVDSHLTRIFHRVSTAGDESRRPVVLVSNRAPRRSATTTASPDRRQTQQILALRRPHHETGEMCRLG